MDLSAITGRKPVIKRAVERLVEWAGDEELSVDAREAFSKLASGQRIYPRAVHQRLLARLTYAKSSRHAEDILISTLNGAPVEAG